MGERVLVAMSGGVDSSVAAALLQEQGHSCAGATLKLFRGGEEAPARQRSCCSLSDVEDARGVAFRLGMPHYVFDFSRQFEETVLCRFAQCYLRGETPNPCIDCNRFVKFSALLGRARALGYDAIATGHYVRREYDAASGRWRLRKGLDPGKDQSYVLYAMTQEQLAGTLFPLGALHKAEVRRLARENGFLNAEKRDSQDICFVPGGDYGAFLERYTGEALAPGDFVDPEGRLLGRHKGTARYTLGQRRGLGLALERPGYVCAINPATRTVTVGEEARLFRRALTASGCNWVSIAPPDAALRCRAKIRYSQQAAAATVERIGATRIRVRFDAPQRAITPGQAVVLYDEDILLGGATIEGEEEKGEEG
ncbi:MAG: tRNA 2-thiouridine(34) synthase MnmA [Oscillospiraceae bacterium]|jgi:tRNA-specific 2-thiouridylase|nr:tRNA 2-thiouridine(34) synthase MnmA [Oscillospiraceae bacterium]